jgi:hypothetical protein
VRNMPKSFSCINTVEKVRFYYGVYNRSWRQCGICPSLFPVLTLWRKCVFYCGASYRDEDGAIYAQVFIPVLTLWGKCTTLLLESTVPGLLWTHQY